MRKKYSRPSTNNESTMSSSSVMSCTELNNGTHPVDEGLLTSALIPTATQLSKVEQASPIHKCADCEYQSTVKKHFQSHRGYHKNKSAHQCPWCSFSVSSMARLAIHARYYHVKTDNKALDTENQVILLFFFKLIFIYKCSFFNSVSFQVEFSCQEEQDRGVVLFS